MCHDVRKKRLSVKWRWRQQASEFYVAKQRKRIWIHFRPSSKYRPSACNKKNWIDSIIHIQGVHGQEDIIYIHNTALDMINENKDCLNNQLYSIPFMWRAMLRIAQYRAEALRHHWRVYMCEWIVNLKEKNGRKQSRNWHFSNRPFISESFLF